MSDQIKIAPFARDESNVTLDEYKAALQAVLLALNPPEDFAARITIERLPETHEPKYYSWVAVSAWKSGVAAIVEIRDTEVVVIAVIRKSLHFYDLSPLWRRYRTRR